MLSAVLPAAACHAMGSAAPSLSLSGLCTLHAAWHLYMALLHGAAAWHRCMQAWLLTVGLGLIGAVAKAVQDWLEVVGAP